jgi:hypothetical protein
MSQRGLDDYGVEAYPDDPFGDVRDWISGIAQTVRSEIQGIAPDWWGRDPSDIEGDIWVYQYVVAYSKGTLRDGYAWDADKGKSPRRQGSPSPEVQFKVGIYVKGEPTTDLIKRLRDIDVYRLVTAFDTREYSGYMSGFGFETRKTYVQEEEVSLREVEQKGYGLGVPWFEVEAYDEDGSLEGWADGFFDPFTKETRTERHERGGDPPEQEVWRVRTGLNESRSVPSWEIGPKQNTPAAQRARNAKGKDVYIGPFQIGTVTKRGTTWLRSRYTGRGKYTDKATITSRSGIPPQALQKGTKLYKFRETDDAVYLSTTKPARGWRPTDPASVSPDDVRREVTVEEVTTVLLEDDEPTEFTIETDENRGRLLGLYSPPVVRDIERETRLVY